MLLQCSLMLAQLLTFPARFVCSGKAILRVVTALSWTCRFHRLLGYFHYFLPFSYLNSRVVCTFVVGLTGWVGNEIPPQHKTGPMSNCVMNVIKIHYRPLWERFLSTHTHTPPCGGLSECISIWAVNAEAAQSCV